MSFGVWLRESRMGAKLTQQEVADRARCSKSYISMLEKGDDLQPSVEKVDALAEALNASRAEARLAAGYASTIQAYEVAMPLARRLDRILRSVPADKRPKIEDALEVIARTMVNAAA